jgi:HAD superfamily hydrolase (TIGR01490 family)
MNLALFDLDNTLLSGDTDVEWLAFLVGQGTVPRSEAQANAQMDRRYRDGSVDAAEYVRFYLRYYPPHEMARLLAWREAFVLERIVPKIAAGARALLESHKADLCVIITATNRFLTEPIAAALGVQHLIATEPQIVGGRFTGEFEGTPCMREGKVERLQAWLRARGESLDGLATWFYSDSINDLPLLERVTHPVAVDPDPRLGKIALTRGWPVVSLRTVNPAGGPAVYGLSGRQE